MAFLPHWPVHLLTRQTLFDSSAVAQRLESWRVIIENYSHMPCYCFYAPETVYINDFR